jgi:hypothetical protein
VAHGGPSCAPPKGHVTSHSPRRQGGAPGPAGRPGPGLPFTATLPSSADSTIGRSSPAPIAVRIPLPFSPIRVIDAMTAARKEPPNVDRAGTWANIPTRGANGQSSSGLRPAEWAESTALAPWNFRLVPISSVVATSGKIRLVAQHYHDGSATSGCHGPTRAGETPEPAKQ